MSMSNEISDSLIEEVLECNELASQWSAQMTGESEGAAADHTADHTDDTILKLLWSRAPLSSRALNLSRSIEFHVQTLRGIWSCHSH